MKSVGWKLSDFKIIKNTLSSYNHIYLFHKNIKATKVAKKARFKKLNLDMSFTPIKMTNQTTATINKGNLQVGQSGIIIHRYKNDDIVIVALGVVKSSTNNNSTIKLSLSSLLNQNALPDTSLMPQNDDIFILNHLYSSSLLIAPNFTVSQKIKNIYKEQNFVNADIFASYLKINNKPTPTKEDIQTFAKSQDIGIIFIALSSKFYILDANSFKILKSFRFYTDDKTTQTPFFTKVEDIQKSFWKFWDFEDSEIKDYNEYYQNILGL
jgi:hypothetical protein